MSMELSASHAIAILETWGGLGIAGHRRPLSHPYMHLYHLRSIIWMPSFIAYRNIWWTSINGNQTMQHKFFTKSKCQDHITPILARLHWLLIEKRMEYKEYCWQPSRQNMAWRRDTSVTSSDHISLLAPSAHWICICSINPDPGLSPMEINLLQCVLLPIHLHWLHELGDLVRLWLLQKTKCWKHHFTG